MKRRKKSGLKSGFILGLAAWLILQTGLVAFAADKPLVDAGKTGSLRFTMLDSESAPVKGGNLQVFKVAEIVQTNDNQNLEYLAVYDGLGSSKRSLKEESSGNISATLKDSKGVSNNNNYAKTLAEYVKTKGIAASKSVTVDTTGKAEITDLSLGLYLVTQPTAATGYNAMAPFLVTVPQWNDTTSSWVYDITDITPKMQALTKGTTPPPEKEPEKTPEKEPEKEPEKTPEKEPEKEPEKTPEKTPTTPTTPTTTTKTPTTTTPTTTTPTTTTTTTTKTPTNTSTNGTTVSKIGPTGTTPEKLPQTGQVNWPIPVLFVFGLIFLGAGIVLEKRK